MNDYGSKKVKMHSNSHLKSYSNVLISIFRIVQSCLNRLLFANHPPFIVDCGTLFHFCKYFQQQIPHAIKPYSNTHCNCHLYDEACPHLVFK